MQDQTNHLHNNLLEKAKSSLLSNKKKKIDSIDNVIPSGFFFYKDFLIYFQPIKIECNEVIFDR